MTRMLACLFLAASAAISVPTADAQNAVTRVELKDVPVSSHSDSSKAVPGPLAAISVTVEAAREQSLGQQGLRLEVTIRNNGARAAAILDPADYIQLQLLNSTGFPVDLPPIPTGGLSPKRPHGSPNSPELEERRPFQFARPQTLPVGTSAGSSPAEPRLQDGLLTLPPGREYRMTLQIHKILADPAGYAAAVSDRAKIPADSRTPVSPPPAVVAIPPDRYSARVQIELVPPGGGEGSRQLQSDPVVVDLQKPPQSAGKARQ